MVVQVQIVPDPIVSQQSKGDFFEDLLRAVMESQRYKVVQRVNFTGTEIDLLCQHLDRPTDTALVECKARVVINSDDIKLFSYDVIVEKRAKYGFFVHTTELKHQAAGLAHQHRNNESLTFWGPDKVLNYSNILVLLRTADFPPQYAFNFDKAHSCIRLLREVLGHDSFEFNRSLSLRGFVCKRGTAIARGASTHLRIRRTEGPRDLGRTDFRSRQGAGAVA